MNFIIDVFIYLCYKAKFFFLFFVFLHGSLTIPKYRVLTEKAQ